jgi:hypothetical protein
MAQYQEWLHYHEVDSHLQAQLAELVNELAQLQEHAYFYEQDIFPPSAEVAGRKTIPLPHDNIILHALATHINGLTTSNGHRTQESLTIPETRSEIIPSEPGEPISLALFAQGNLPNFETPSIPAEIPNTDASQFTSYLDQPLPPIPHYAMALLPEDMVAFFDQHSTTDPQIELPWWLHNLTNGSNGSGPIDQESFRTNRLVQRWLERWGKQSPHSQKSGENQ